MLLLVRVLFFSGARLNKTNKDNLLGSGEIFQDSNPQSRSMCPHVTNNGCSQRVGLSCYYMDSMTVAHIGMYVLCCIFICNFSMLL